VQHFISQYGYVAVFLLMLAESACIPIPSEVIMLFGGALAAGAVPGAHPALAGIVLAGVLGNVAGSYVSWAVGRYAGQAAVRRWGRRVGLRGRPRSAAPARPRHRGRPFPVATARGPAVPLIGPRLPGAGQATVTWIVWYPVAPFGSAPWLTEVCV
jgi:hypothetical protein